MSTPQLYDAFVTEAFTEYRIPNRITLMAKDWVCAEVILDRNDLSQYPENDLGYAELAEITDYDAEMRSFSLMHSLDQWRSCVRSMKQKHRQGRGAYRTLLKLFYLYRLK